MQIKLILKFPKRHSAKQNGGASKDGHPIMENILANAPKENRFLWIRGNCVFPNARGASRIKSKWTGLTETAISPRGPAQPRFLTPYIFIHM